MLPTRGRPRFSPVHGRARAMASVWCSLVFVRWCLGWCLFVLPQVQADILRGGAVLAWGESERAEERVLAVSAPWDEGVCFLWYADGQPLTQAPVPLADRLVVPVELVGVRSYQVAIMVESTGALIVLSDPFAVAPVPTVVNAPLPAGLAAQTVVETLPSVAWLTVWRQVSFGTPQSAGLAADNADADADGTGNFLEYALGQNPLVNDPAAAPSLRLSADGRRLALTFALVADPALHYTVEASNDLRGEWIPIWQSQGADNVSGLVEVPDVQELASGRGLRMLRLVVAVNAEQGGSR